MGGEHCAQALLGETLMAVMDLTGQLSAAAGYHLALGKHRIPPDGSHGHDWPALCQLHCTTLLSASTGRTCTETTKWGSFPLESQFEAKIDLLSASLLIDI